MRLIGCIAGVLAWVAVADAGPRRSEGTLAGKTVYLSAGHGWVNDGGWKTQRGNTHGLVEDFITIENVNEYLIDYLHAMGAYVVPIREADRNPNVVIVDDLEATIEGTLEEVTSADAGWGMFATPITDVALQPFAIGTTRKMTAAPTETGRAVFASEVPVPGHYNVYIAYAQGPDRVADAHVIVRHAGGESHLRVDQRRHGSTWMLLGRWYFDGPAAVAFANDSTMQGVISFDAVRFGGGMAIHAPAGATTNRPAYESASVYSTQLLGAPQNVYNYFGADGTDDIVARPRFAAWEHEAGEDAIYVAWHTNAPNPGRGTMSIAFGNTYPCCRGLDDFAGTPGSLELLHAVHDEIVRDIRAGFDPNWRDLGKVTAALGELNTSHQNEMPAILVELAFHDTLADADALREPAFRRITARAMAQGIARYFAEKDGRALVLPPEAPTHVKIENAGKGKLRVSWRPPAAAPGGGDAPERYRVVVGAKGYGFDDGVLVDGESLVLENLPPAALRFVRVHAVNAGGESPPSEIVAARLAASGKAPILVVGGFDRLDRFMMLREAAPGLGMIDRSRLDRMNDGTYAVRHALALAGGGYAFDGATDDVVAANDIELRAYAAVDWFTGEQANADALGPAAREQITALLAGGGKLLFSGAEQIWALDTQGTDADRTFTRDVLRTGLVMDDAETYDVAASTGGPFAALPAFSFAETGPGSYDADFPDVLEPVAGAEPVLAYASGGAAAIAWPGGIVLGFPLELIEDASTRRAFMTAAMAHFGIAQDPDQPEDADPPTDDPAGCGCGTSNPGGFLLVLAVVLFRARRRR